MFQIVEADLARNSAPAADAPQAHPTTGQMDQRDGEIDQHAADAAGQVDQHAADTTPAPQSKSGLAAQIRELQRKIAEVLLPALAHALDAGDLLLDAKRRIPPRGWTPFLVEC